MSVLVDTSLILAALGRREKRHSWAKRTLISILTGKYGTPYTTDYIIDEVLSYAAARLSPSDAKKLLDLLVRREAFRVIPVTIDVFRRAADLYEKHLPRLSFTDATTLVVAELYSIDYVATMDHSLARLHPSIHPG